ncbi:hypothetical protein CHS0354_031884 [Potamilus streckersoni]|uniref:UHRF1-binding protein 1-like n=1 Tax=Potamilus streckersoni TaxID=2493646 RepID=A0AAE0RXW1_9BIVA|nr:hypothetical protein CHS0354_031884 [Potamilus streckersoni]
MASILKNQILKHLSKFTKNLSPDKINLSTLKGEGELVNLELDEVILMDLLDLPTWMKLNKAYCNKLSIKVQWTKIKSQPLCLYLDEVVLEIETCDNPRKANSPAQTASYRTGGKYGLVDKVIDGIYVHINAVTVNLRSKKFNASLQLSRVKVHSTNPTWGQTTDLRQSRIRDPDRNEILLFKEIDWQTTRIEANAKEDEAVITTPLRLIANQSKIRITMKKRLSDCSIISSRVVLLLDDLLWVLTNTQLKAAILYANSLEEMIKKSTEQSKKLAAEKLQKQGQMGVQQSTDQQQRVRSQSMNAGTSTGANTSTASKIFAKYDVPTTSYHVITSRIDLHLCDDAIPGTNSSPKHNQKIDGGAMQITLCKLTLDFYPFHPADIDLIQTCGGERKQWYRYLDNQGSRNHWVQQLFKSFGENARRVRNACGLSSPSQSPDHSVSQKFPVHAPGSFSPQNVNNPQPPSRPAASQSVPSRPLATAHQSGSKNQSNVSKLLESCIVIRVEEFTIYQISTADNKRNAPKKFLCSDKKQLHLPADMSVIHIEYTDYFFTEGIDSPVPHANLYVLVNPVNLTVDYLTLLWANCFSLNLAQFMKSADVQQTTEHIDIKVEALMPRIVISEERVESQPERPQSLQIQFSRITATNTCVEDGTTLTNLRSVLEDYKQSDLFTSVQFPNDGNNMSSIPKHFYNYACSEFNPYVHKYTKSLCNGIVPEKYLKCGTQEAVHKLFHTNTLKLDRQFDIWHIKVDQLWLEFLGVPTNRARPVPFVESFPLVIWLAGPALNEGQNSSDVPRMSMVQEAKISLDVSDTGISSQWSHEHLTETKMSHLKHGRANSFESVIKGDEYCAKRPGRETLQEERQSKRLLREFYKLDEIYDDKGKLSHTSQHENSKDSSIKGDKQTSPASTMDSSLNPGSGSFSATQPKGDNVQCITCQIADFNIVAKIGSKVRVQLNHYQYLFLLRMTESLTKFQTELNADAEIFGGSSMGKTICIPLVIPDFEFATVCPVIAELLPCSQRLLVPSDPCSPLTEDSENINGYDESGELLGTESDPVRDAHHNANVTEDQQFLTITTTADGPKLELSDNISLAHTALIKSQSDSTIVYHTMREGVEDLVTLKVQASVLQDSMHSVDKLSSASSEGHVQDILTSHAHSVASDSGLSSFSLSQVNGHQRSRSNSKVKVTKATDQMKKSFVSAVTNFSNIADKLKNKLEFDDSSSQSDDLETMSLRTDQSDDDVDFEFLTLDESEMPAFSHSGARTQLDTTSSCGTDGLDDLSSIYADSTSASKGKEMVSVVVFRLIDIEFLIQGTGIDTFIRIQAKALQSAEPGNVVYEEFYEKLSNLTGFITDPKPSTESFPIKLKFILGPAAGKETPEGPELGFMGIKVKDFSLGLKMSSITNLTSFGEDEKLADTIPMHVNITNLTVHLEEDRPPVNVTSPGPVPIHLKIHELSIRRNKDGVMHLIGGSFPTLTQESRMSDNIQPIELSEEKTKKQQASLEQKDKIIERDEDLNSLPLSVQQKLDSLWQENELLKRLLKDMEHLHEQEANTSAKSQKQKISEALHQENKQLEEKVENCASSSSLVSGENLLQQEKEELEKVNQMLHSRVAYLEDELEALKQEKESLISTLKFLQEELIASEQRHDHHNS